MLHAKYIVRFVSRDRRCLHLLAPSEICVGQALKHHPDDTWLKKKLEKCAFVAFRQKSSTTGGDTSNKKPSGKGQGFKGFLSRKAKHGPKSTSTASADSSKNDNSSKSANSGSEVGKRGGAPLEDEAKETSQNDKTEKYSTDYRRFETVERPATDNNTLLLSDLVAALAWTDKNAGLAETRFFNSLWHNDYNLTILFWFYSPGVCRRRRNGTRGVFVRPRSQEGGIPHHCLVE